jgi:hypothetical protein
VILERYVGPKDWDSAVYLDRIRRLLASGARSEPKASGGGGAGFAGAVPAR